MGTIEDLGTIEELAENINSFLSAYDQVFNPLKMTRITKPSAHLKSS